MFPRKHEFIESRIIKNSSFRGTREVNRLREEQGFNKKKVFKDVNIHFI